MREWSHSCSDIPAGRSHLRRLYGVDPGANIRTVNPGGLGDRLVFHGFRVRTPYSKIITGRGKFQTYAACNYVTMAPILHLVRHAEV